MGAANKVIAGDYEGCMIGQFSGKPYIIVKITKSLDLNKSTVEGYELLTDEQRKSAASAVGRGAAGGLLLGAVGLAPLGMLAGGISAKNKGIYTIAIKFKDGKSSLLEVDDKYYKAIVKSLF